MAGVKISALPAVTSAILTDYFPVVQADVTKRETLDQVATLFGFTDGILDVPHGGTGLSAAGHIPVASTFSAWDSSRNFSANNFIPNYSETVTSAGTRTLTVSSSYYQYFTGSTTHTVVMPVTSTFPDVGFSFFIVNNSSGVVTVNSSGGNLIQAMAASTVLLITCISLSGTTAASWNATYISDSLITLPVSLSDGGTSKALTASAGGIVWSDADSMEILAGVSAAGKMLRSGNLATPSWSTAVWPDTGGTAGSVVISDGTDKINSTSLWPNTVGSSGTLVRSNGTSNAYSTATFSDTYDVSTLLYAGSSNTVSGLTTENDGLLVTSNTGVPSILAGPGTTGNLLQSNASAAPSFSTATFPSVSGASGSIVISDGTNHINSTSLWPNTVGAAGTIIRSNGTINTYSTATFADTYSVRSLLYASASNVVSGLASAANGLLVTNSTSVPSILAGPGVTGKILQSNAAAAPSFSTATFPSAAGTSGNVLISDGTNRVSSTSLWPNTVGATGSIVRSDGTTNAYSVSLWPNTVGASGSIIRSDGTTNAYSVSLWPNTVGVSGSIVRSDGTTNAYSTSLWPNTVGTSGTVLRSDGTTNAYSTSTFADTYTANNLLYASASNTVAGLATANNGTLITSGAGVPSISSTLPTAVQDNITRLGTIANIGASLGVAFGGTGAATFTAYSVICGGTTSTGPFQNVSGLGTSGYALTSNGAGALPTWQGVAFKQVKVVQVSATSTYTPTANAKGFIVEIVGGGGGAGAITGGTAGNAAISGGGGGGGYTRKSYTLAELGANAAVTIGAGGTGGTGAGAGGAGGSTTFIPGGSGASLTATGGTGGSGMTQSTAFQMSNGGNPGGVGSSGDFNETGTDGQPGIAFAAAGGIFGGRGGGSLLCANCYTHGATSGGGSGGTRSSSFGQGASGRYSVGTGGSTGDGQPGNPGVVVVTEFISF